MIREPEEYQLSAGFVASNPRMRPERRRVHGSGRTQLSSKPLSVRALAVCFLHPKGLPHCLIHNREHFPRFENSKEPYHYYTLHCSQDKVTSSGFQNVLKPSAPEGTSSLRLRDEPQPPAPGARGAARTRGAQGGIGRFGRASGMPSNHP